MASPAELSARFLDAYNRRDPETMRSMLSTDVTFIRPGPTRIEGVDAIIELYQNDWEEFNNQNAIRRIIEAGDQVAMEITAVFDDAESSVEYDLAVVLRWVDNRLVYYRLYVDPIPDI